MPAPSAGPGPRLDAGGAPGRPISRVLVVEDQRALAGALEVAIGAQPDLDCVGAVGSADEAVALAAAVSPDVVLMDIHLPGVDGIEATRQVLAVCPGARVLILTGDATPARLAAATASGAAGFLAKDSAFPDILAAIRAPANGTMLVEAATLAALAESLGAGGPAGHSRAPDRPGLTARERQVLALMGEGLDPRGIAEQLVVSLHTARGHVKSILMKLGAHSQLEAVVVATREGLLPASVSASAPKSG